MNIECRIIESRDIQVNASHSPPPVWKMDLYLFKHDENLSYTYDRYSLIWFTYKYCYCPSHDPETCPMPPHTPFPSIWNARHAWTLNLPLHIIMIIKEWVSPGTPIYSKRLRFDWSLVVTPRSALCSEHCLLCAACVVISRLTKPACCTRIAKTSLRNVRWTLLYSHDLIQIKVLTVF